MDVAFNLESMMWVVYILTNLMSIGLLLGSRWYPTVTRLLYFFLFMGAGIFNIHTAQATPWVYYDYEDYAFLEVYRWFISGPFTEVTVPMIYGIALCQLTIAVTMLLKGKLFKWGCIGGILFGLAIAPLGFGSAFPATLFMSAGFYMLYRIDTPHYLWSYIFLIKTNQPTTPV